MNRKSIDTTQVQKQHSASECSICRNKHAFQMPDHIVDDLKLGNLVFFAGAGVSTENSTVFPFTLYDDVKAELGVSRSETISFSELMTRYCAQPNGRKKLFQKIRRRLTYIRSFPEIDSNASRFHRELSTLFPVDTIITTNWDDYFETACGAIPFVTAEDFAFWDLPGRKVFKIHGSINNWGSIVATAEDYDTCHRNLRDGILGGALKQTIGTKTMIFVGYSFRDEDFEGIYGFLVKEMGPFLPHSYIVTLNDEDDDKFRKLGLTPIYTDAAYFVSVLKEHLVLEGEMLADQRFESVFPGALSRVMEEHSRFLGQRISREHPNSVYVLAYQDGLIHAFSRMAELLSTGSYSHLHGVANLIEQYLQIRKDKLKSKAYFDIAYIDGYINGLRYYSRTIMVANTYHCFTSMVPKTILVHWQSIAKRSRPRDHTKQHTRGQRNSKDASGIQT